MRCAGETHRDWAFRVAGVLAVAVLLLLWPATAYGCAGSANHPSRPAPGIGHLTASRALPTDLYPAFPHPALGRDTPALVPFIPAGAWAWALRCVGYPDARGVISGHRQEQTAVHVAPTLHLSR